MLSSLLYRLRNVPLNPGKTPFFYGWVILGAGTIGVLASLPGQTIGVSVFTDFLVKDLNITRSQLSLTYLVGTTISAFFLPRFGRMLDRWGARLLAVLAALGLAGILLVMSHAPGITDFIVEKLPFLEKNTAAIGFLCLSFFLMRFFGQGNLTLASRNMVLLWFDRRRGIVNALYGTFTAMGFSLAPRIFEALIQGRGWQEAWRLIAGILAVFSVFAFLFFRNRPEEHGLIPDGQVIPVRSKHSLESTSSRDYTLKEAQRTYSFWIFSLAIFMASLLGTAGTFHIVSLFAEAGRGRAEAVMIFLPSAVVAVTAQFAGSLISDYVQLKYLLMVYLTGMMVFCVSLTLPGLPIWGLIAGMGIMTGFYGIFANIPWPRFYGRRHLGAISGFSLSMAVAGSAVGPLFFSLVKDLTGTFRTAGIISLVFLGALFLGSVKADRPGG